MLRVFLFSSCFVALAGLSAQAASRNEAAIAEVAAGKRADAQAIWWGFDENDATDALQAAIRSGARKLVINNTGKPWNVRPLELASNLEIVFEPGCVVQALRGAFKKKHEMLFVGRGVKNVNLSGSKATLRMWKSDYQNAQAYEKSEWRHALAFYACENVTIDGLTIEASGGDGIYLGAGSGGAPCRKVTLRKVTCADNHRQGISVISAEDLLIEDGVFKDTAGTAPQAGIDFEPNSAAERLKHCVLRRCRFENNAADGILFALGQLDSESEPISILLDQCSTLGNNRAVRVSLRNPAGVTGSIDFTRCRFERSRTGGVEFTGKAVRAAAVRLDRCELIRLATEKPDEPAIVLKSRGMNTETLGGIRFDQCVIEQDESRKLLFYDDVGGARVKDITGTLTIRESGKERAITLSQAQLDEWFPWSAELKDYARFNLKGLGFSPLNRDAKGPFPAIEAAQRGTGQWIVFANSADESLSFSLQPRQIGRGDKPAALPVRLIAPSGKVTELPPLPFGGSTPYSIRTGEAGVHRLIVEAGQHTTRIVGSDQPACLMSLSGAFHFVGRSGPLFFLVPAGIKEFGLKVAGGGGAEHVQAVVKDASGKTAAQFTDISGAKVIPLTRGDGSGAEVWSLLLDKPATGVLEDVQFLVEGVPAILAGSAEALLGPVK